MNELFVYLSKSSTLVIKGLNKMNDQKEISQELKQLYKAWPETKRFLKTLGCTSVNAEDIFQEALIIFVRKKEDPNFVLSVEPFFYVKNTCKLLWFNQSRKEQKTGFNELTGDLTEEQNDWFEKEMKLRSIESALNKIGKQCQELLQLFYGLGWSMVEIAKKLDLRNDKVAKAQKYRCINKVKDQLELESTSEINH